MKKVLFVWSILTSLALVSCGGGQTVKVTTEIDITMTDFQFSPNSFTVPPGQEITLNVSNTGGVIHSFVIMQQGKSAGTEYTDEDLPNVYWEVEIQPNVSSETSFVAPGDPGEYEVICHIPGHLQAGMVGKLDVVAEE